MIQSRIAWKLSSPKNVEAITGKATMTTGIRRQCTVQAVEIRIAALSLNMRARLSIYVHLSQSAYGVCINLPAKLGCSKFKMNMIIKLYF